MGCGCFGGGSCGFGGWMVVVLEVGLGEVGVVMVARLRLSD